MGPVNNILNRVDGLSHQDSLFKSIICSRATNLFVTTPTELLAVAQNVILTPIQAASSILKLGTKTVACISGSETIKNFDAKLPGLTDLLRTVARIVAYSIGTVLTATLGVISPKANFAVQCGIGLAINLREEEILAAQEEAEIAEARKQYELLLAKLEAEKAEDAAQAAKEAQRSAEQEALNNLALAYETAEKIETQVEDSILEDIEPFFTACEEEIEQFEDEIEETHSLVSQALTSTVNTGKAIVSSTYSTGKILVNNTFNVIIHPVRTTQHVYNYVAHFFIGLKA